MDNTLLILVAFCLVIFISNVIQGITGFAGTLIAMPFLILLVDMETAKQVLNFLGIIGSALILVKDYQYIRWTNLKVILSWMSLGLLIGMVTYQVAPRKFLMILFPFFVLYVGVRGLWQNRQNVMRSTKSSSLKDALILLLGGIIHGLFVSGGPLLVVYATERLHDKREFRATLSASWIFLNSIMLIEAAFNRVLTVPILSYMVLSIIPMSIGIILGGYLLKRMNQHFFMVLSYFLLLGSGISLLISL